MSSLLFFVAGFVAAAVVALLLGYAIGRQRRVAPIAVNNSTALQQCLRQLLNQKSLKVLYFRDNGTQALIRVHKFVRRNKADTLGLELRRSDAGLDHYIRARDALKDGGIEFREDLTPKRRLPRRLHIRFPSGGPLAVTFMQNAVALVSSALNPEETLDLLVGTKEPSLWIAHRAGGAT